MNEIKTAAALMYKEFGIVHAVKFFREHYKTTLRESFDIINRDIPDTAAAVRIINEHRAYADANKKAAQNSSKTTIDTFKW